MLAAFVPAFRLSTSSSRPVTMHSIETFGAFSRIPIVQEIVLGEQSGCPICNATVTMTLKSGRVLQTYGLGLDYERASEHAAAEAMLTLLRSGELPKNK